MDDTKYFTFGNSTLAENSWLCTKDFQGSPDNIKYKGVAKFEPKMLVWCTISEAGISERVFGQVRGQALYAERYVEQCLPKLIDFVQKFHGQDEIIFWSDFAFCHYAKIATN